MDDLTLREAIDALRAESEDHARALTLKADARLVRAGDDAAQAALEADRYVTVRNIGEVERFFVDETRKQVSDWLAPQLQLATARDAEAFARATGLPLRADQLDRLAEALRFGLDWLPRLPDMTAAWLSDQLRAAVLGRVPTLQVVDGLRRYMATTVARYAATQVETTLQIMDQLTIDVATADLGYELLAYAGPDDVVTRPFCHHCANRVFPRQALADSQNGQIANVLVSRGGYKCRHRIRPILRMTAEYLKLPIIEPYRLVTEVQSPGDPHRGVPPRIIVYPVAA